MTKSLILYCSFNYVQGEVLFPDFVWRVCKKIHFGYFVFIWWQTDKKTRKLAAELQGSTLLIKSDPIILQHRSQWSISKYMLFCSLASAKSKYPRILDFRFLHGYLRIDDTER